MEDGFNKHSANHPDGGNNEIYSKVVRAGKRTYFFDVKATRRSDYYITITESKRQVNDLGGFTYEKHKVFLYSEDFDKFINELLDVVGFVNEKTGKNSELLDSVELKETQQTSLEYKDL